MVDTKRLPKNVALANALRRIIISEVPTLAISEIEVEKNTSSQHNWKLCERLGLIPLVGETECVATLDCEYDEEAENTIYSGDLVFENPNVYPVMKDIPIVTLSKGQAIRLNSTCKTGIGKEHAKWSPVSMATFVEDEEGITLTIESVGQLSGKEIFSKAITILQKKLENVL